MALLHIGTYSNTGGRGLVPLTLADDGALTPGEPFAEAANASFGASGNGLVYLVDEQDEGAVNVLRPVGETWERMARVTSGGAAPCYLSLSPDGRRLAVANYESGTAALYRLGSDGLPQSPPAVFHNVGRGPNAERQEGPHLHCARFAPDREALYLVDLGADQVVCLSLTEDGFGEASVAWTAPAGSGPRHMLLHPTEPRALVLSELAATLTLLQRGSLGFETLNCQQTAPGGDRGKISAGISRSIRRARGLTCPTAGTTPWRSSRWSMAISNRSRPCQAAGPTRGISPSCRTSASWSWPTRRTARSPRSTSRPTAACARPGSA